jgi:hypothetical protein
MTQLWQRYRNHRISIEVSFNPIARGFQARTRVCRPHELAPDDRLGFRSTGCQKQTDAIEAVMALTKIAINVDIELEAHLPLSQCEVVPRPCRKNLVDAS